MFRYLLIFLLILFSADFLFAQYEKQIPDELLDAIITQIAENKEQEEVDETILYDDLTNFLQNPINLNHTDREELSKLQFLTSTQVENILAYVKQNGQMESLYELQLIDGLFTEDIRFMIPFVMISQEAKKPVSLKFGNIFKYGKNEILTRVDRGLETREGYKFVPEEELIKNPNKQFVGDPWYVSLRYRFNYGNRVLFGFSAEKDAGEQFWGEHNKGFDFYSAYLQLNDIGKFKTIVVGNFSAAFGQGLVINQSYGFGKSSMVMNVEQRTEGLRKYTSTAEYNYMQGVGATMKFGETELTAFYSNKKIDGDTIEGTFSSIKTDGLHQTVGDLDKKHTVGMQVIGGHVSHSFDALKVGFTLQNTHFNHTLLPRTYIYNQFYFAGDNQTAGSVDYKLRWRKFYLFGETAMLDNNAMATLNGLTVSPTSTISFIVLQRYFAPEYDAIFSSAFAETSRVNNENGLYFGAEVRPFRSWKFSAYADSYTFPWIKYGINTAGSTGYDLFFQADYVPKRNVTMYWRAKYESKADNMTDSLSTYSIGTLDKGYFRYVLQYSITSQLKLRNVFEVTYAKQTGTDDTYGYLLRQDLSYTFRKIPFSFNLCYEFFDAVNYENRIYAYEQDILYAFSVPALYGVGSRYYLNAKYTATKNLTFYFKIAQTVYMDRDIISSGINAIDDNRKTDFRLLVKWRF